MANVLDEVVSEELTRDHVQRRVDDWQQRIKALYRNVDSWLPNDWRSERRRTTRMSEEMMREFEVAPIDVPVLDLIHHGSPVGAIEPRGLWIVGANGWLDLRFLGEHYVIVDLAENFAPPDWRISPLANRRDPVRLDQSSFRSVIRA